MKTNKSFIENYIQTTKELFRDNSISYVSTPITTGRRYLNWYNSEGKKFDKNSIKYKEELTMNVKLPNIKDSKKIIKNIKKQINSVVIDPTNIENNNLEWSQTQFYLFWDRIIENLIESIYFIDGWEYSLGCCNEMLSSIKNDISIYNQNMELMNINSIIIKLEKSMNDYKINNLEEYKEIEEIIENIKGLSKTKLTLDNDINLKDEKLEFLAKNNLANIAQFLSFEPKYEGNPRYINIKNVNNTKSFSNQELVEKLIESSNSKAVNIRSFSLNKMKGNKLIYNKKLKNLEEILKLIKENSISNKYTIINENIDINDGGVSGVILGNTIEFAPEDTPKCVDKKGVCSLPRDIGIRILNTVYGFSPELDFDLSYRIEFSLHPLRQGLKNRHTIIWEYEYYDKIEEDNKIIWPNRFSKFIGDKAFGLLVADSLGFNVPRTTVISRKVAPFNFGRHTGLSEKWIRTCPILKEPGKYFTGKSWKDPFKLMKDEEIKGDKEINIASILSQDAVEAIYSGAAIISKNKIQDIIEGVKGNGDDFMLGKSSGINLPINVYEKVKSVSDEIRNYSNELGEVSIEWVYDGKEVWIMQINQLKDNSYSYKNNSRIIVEGNVEKYEKLNVDDGLEALRNKIKLIKNKNIGIELIGDIGITSHFADLLRLNSIPSRIKKNLE